MIINARKARELTDSATDVRIANSEMYRTRYSPGLC